MAHFSLVVPVVASEGFTRNEVSPMSTAPKQLRSDARVNTRYLACPSGHQPGLDNEEKEEWVVVENSDSLAAPAVTSQGASRKQSS